MRATYARSVWTLWRRALNEIFRVPAATIPGLLAPTVFLLGLTSVFGNADRLPGYGHASFLEFIIGVSLLQGAGFTGAATGVNLARDIEQGWFDRLLVAPVPRSVLLAGIAGSAALRALMPATVLLVVGLVAGARFPGVDGLLVIAPVVCGYAAVAACWGMIVALRFKTQQAAPLMQVGTFLATLLTTAYAPRSLMTGWLGTTAEVNPVTRLLQANRQGFIGAMAWSTTWHALLALAGLTLLFGGLALRSLRRAGV